MPEADVLRSSRHDPGRRLTRRRVGLAASSLALLLAAAGCSNPGEVKDFNAQTQSNFVDACKAANDEGLDEAEVDRICGCWYDAIVDDENISFDQFKQENENITEAIDENRFNNEDDFNREAPNVYRIVTSIECDRAAGP